MKNEKGSVPLRYWVLWWTAIVIFDFVFYVAPDADLDQPARDRVARGVSRSSPALGEAMAAPKMHADEIDTDVALVRRLLAGQFPQWAESADRSGRLVRDRSRHLPAR